MSNLIPGNQKHLTLNDRLYIEHALDEGRSFRDIAKYLCKDPTTISREVRLHRSLDTWHKGSFNNPYNFCIHRFKCRKTNVCNKLLICDQKCASCHKCNQICDRFEKEACRHLDKAPFVCNGCSKARNLCSIPTKYSYDAHFAQRKYEELRTSSREGIAKSRAEIHRINSIAHPLIMQGQSPYVILTNHPELDMSVRTMYKYIDIGVLITRNIDLKRKVKFKTRKVHKTQIKDRAVFENRTYDDFKALNLQLSEFWEMDTVLSARGCLKCILTFVDPEISLFYARLLPCHEPCYVERAFDTLENTLGGVYEFQSMLPVILTDRGSEFGKPDNLETNKDGIIRTSIYYCDPMRSGQKGCLEEAHTLLRMILPKGTVFTDLTQWDIRRIVNHMNSYARKNLEGATPYQLALKKYGPEILEALQIKFIPPDEVTMSPDLLKK